jgi:hypothetical protein
MVTAPDILFRCCINIFFVLCSILWSLTLFTGFTQTSESALGKVNRHTNALGHDIVTLRVGNNRARKKSYSDLLHLLNQSQQQKHCFYYRSAPTTSYQMLTKVVVKMGFESADGHR